MTYAEAQAAVAADPKIKALVETASSIPVRLSKDYNAEPFRLIGDADTRFNELYEAHKDGWAISIGNKTRGFALFARKDEIFVLNLDKRSYYNPPDEG